MAAGKKKELKVGTIGYGPAFGMGKYHLDSMRADAGFVPWAVCDVRPERLAAARADFAGIETYGDVGEMLRKSDVELLAIILPHNLHAPVALQCLNAGRHVVTEKPFALSVEECDRMIAAARANKVMLSAFHNRHWDANILTIMKHLGKIGRPYRWESFHGGWSKPRDWWRSDKKISGGLIFDWGSHFTEWMLQVMPYEMTEISGFGLKEVWPEATIEDELEAVVRFGGHAVGSHTQTMSAAADKPMIRICGTKGAILATHSSVVLHTVDKAGNRIATTVPMEKGAHGCYYANVGDHILRGRPLIITPERARRVIQVLDCATRSAQQHKALKPKYK